MTLAIAHRGASAYKPENTIAAFRAAVDYGSDGIELDVHSSADGIIVVHHDPVIDGVVIGDVEFDALESALPTLSDSLEVIGGDTIVYIEVKSLPPRFDKALMDVIANGPRPSNCQVHGFDHRIVHRLVTAHPDLHGGVLSASYPIHPIKQISDASAGTLWQQGTLIDADLVDLVHTEGMRIIAWTVDDPEHMRRLQQMGVDGICSNTPDVARRVLQ